MPRIMHPNTLANLVPPNTGQGVPNAGRKHGSRDRLPQLPPVHFDGEKIKVYTKAQGESAVDYWDRQAPNVLHYIFRRLNNFIAYADKGIHDPLGHQIFNTVTKELIKSVNMGSIAKHKVTPPVKAEGKGIKDFRNKLVDMQQSFTIESSTKIDKVDDDGIQDLTEGLGLGLDDMPDEF